VNMGHDMVPSALAPVALRGSAKCAQSYGDLCISEAVLTISW